MFINLLKTAFRNITHKFGYSFMNILGMTLGITSALFLILYVTDELSFDRYHEKAERIFRVQSHITETDDEFTWIVAQIPFAPQVKEDYPEVENIACLGLFGLASYTTERRTREIGIRKVFGASIPRVLRLITSEFLILILVSFALSIPAVWFLMSDWLQNYVYRIDLGPLVFLWTILLILVPTALTISYQSYKAATANPADSIRVE